MRVCSTRLLLCAAVLAAWLLAAGPCVRAAETYDATVMVVQPGTPSAQVVVSYSRPVNHAALSRGIAGLAKATGATVRGVSVREEPLLRGATGRGTSAEFTAMGLVRNGAPLPVEALVRAAPDWQRLRLAFLLGPNFTFAGPVYGQAAGRSYRLINQRGSYEYDVGGTSREGPASTEPGQTTPTSAPRARQGQQASGLKGGIRTVLIAISLLMLAVAMWMVVQSLRKDTGRPRG